MKRLLIAFFLLISVGALAQDGHIRYKETGNTKNIGRFVMPRLDSVAYDSLTSVHSGTMVFDSLKDQLMIYSEDDWRGVAVGYYDTTLTIAAASVLTLNGTAVDLAPKPGANKMIVPVSAMIRYKWNSAAYTANTDVELKIKGSSASFATATGILAATAERFDVMDIAAGAYGSANMGVQVVNTSGNPATGDSDIVIYFSYRIVDTP